MGDCESIALLCLDLDQFKMVNDTLGHPIGDQLLIAVAERIRGTVRKGDTVARLGGDEFAIVQRGVESEDEASALAGRIIRVVSKPYDLDCHRVSVGVSIGIAMAPATAGSGRNCCAKPTWHSIAPNNRAAGPCAFSSRRWTTSFRAAAKWNTVCARRSGRTSSNSTTSPSLTPNAPADRFRGPAALEPPNAGHGAAKRIHPRGRRNRTDRRDRRVGYRAGLCPGRVLAAGSVRGSELVRRAVSRRSGAYRGRRT